MNSARMITPGASSAPARARSFSARRVRRETGGDAMRRPPPVTIASFKMPLCAGVDLAQLARGPLHRFLGLRLATAGLRIHHGDDVLVPGLGGFLVGLAGEA